VRVAAGLRVRVGPVTMARFTAAVRDYLDTCRANDGLLSRKYHPTENGAVKLIFHRTPDEARDIREAFRTEQRNRGHREGGQ
jgi:hypothetical protein